MKIKSKLWIGIIALAILSPMGIILPKYFKAGSAWGEWGADKSNAILPDYAFKGWEQKSMVHLSFAYIVSAVLGLALVVAVIYFIGKFLIKGK